MPYPAAPTESGGDKLHFLTTDGNVAGGWFGVDTGVTGTGANTVAFAAIATHVHDDAAGSPGGLATSSVPLVLVGGVRDDSLGGLTPAAGDAVYLLVDANGALWTHDNALDAALDGSELQVDIVTMPAVDTELPTAVAAADNLANPTAPSVLSHLMVWDSATWDRAPGNAADGLLVNLGANNDVTISGAVDTELPAAASLGDATANPTVPAVGSFLMGWNETTWDRLVSSIVNGLEVDVTRVQGNVAVTHAALTELEAAINASRMDVNVAASVALDVSAATVTVDTELPPAGVLGDAVANPTVPAVGSFLMGFDGTDWERVRVTNTGQLHVEVQGSVAVTHAALTELAAAINASRMDVNIAASVALDVSAATVTVDLGTDNDVLADGSVAHDALDSGGLGPVKIGGRAQEPEAQPEEVADNDRVDALFDRNGYLRVRGDFDPQFADINDASSGDNTIIAAQAAGKRIAVWAILLIADGTVDVRFEDGAGGTAFTGQIPLQAREGYSISAGGLVPLFVGAAATLFNLELSAAINVHGFVSFTVIDD